MEIEFGASVIDRHGDFVGSVAHIVLDTWTGEPRKFVVRRKAPQNDLFFSPEDVSQVAGGQVQVKLTSEELNGG